MALNKSKYEIMKKYIITIMAFAIAIIANAQSPIKEKSMKLNAGIITEKLKETKTFYTQVLNFDVTFENEWFVLLHTPNKQDEIGFLLPNHTTQKPIFQSPFSGKEVFITIQVNNVDAEYQRIKKLKIPIEVDLRDEPWGDRHFAIVDPNGIGVDIVTYTAPTNK